uniref:Uncharacterized protein n=1 Tax=Hucho hucho TaxID=62062 RepID=A0A4W5NLI4_9TELE
MHKIAYYKIIILKYRFRERWKEKVKANDFEKQVQGIIEGEHVALLSYTDYPKRVNQQLRDSEESNTMAAQLQKPEKRYDPGDTTLKFVKRPDDITGDDYPEILKAEMSCGHSVTPESLTEWCRMLLNQKKFKFTCPATDKNGEECGVEWLYQEVRKKALLTSEEIHEFEETLAYLFSSQNSSEYKPVSVNLL